MENEPRNKVINTHWYKEVALLPTNAVYIGRPSKHGNAYSTKSGQYTREECIALHLVDLYHKAVSDPLYIPSLREELGDHDLACWCKQPKKIVGCHGDNFLHVLSDTCKDRTYDRSVVYYLMSDVKTAIAAVHQQIFKELPTETFLLAYVCFCDMRLNIENAVKACRDKEVSADKIEYLLARFFVSLELARQETNLAIIEYRLMHICWMADVFVTGRPDLFTEPHHPDLPLKPVRKGKNST